MGVKQMVLMFMVCVLTLLGCGGGGGGGSGGTGGNEVAVSGRIVDSGGAPVSNATVTINSTPVSTSTNAEGLFTVAVPPGEHQLTVSKGGVTFCSRAITVATDAALVLGDISPTTTYYAADDDGGANPSKPWIGEWLLVNFLSDNDGGVWDSDDSSGIGMTATVTEDAWVESDTGCGVRFSYSVDGQYRYSKTAAGTIGSCGSFPLGWTETGRLEFSDSFDVMIDWYDPDPDDDILAFKWQRQGAN